MQLMKDIFNECKMSKQQLITFLVWFSCEHPKQLSNIITPRSKLNMYLEYLFNVLEEELSGENAVRWANCHINIGTLDNDDLDVLLCGSQLGQWRLAQCDTSSDTDSSDNDESLDEDYNPLWDIESDIEFSDSVSENSLELNDELQNILDTSSDNEENFLDEVLQNFKQLNNKHDWSHTNSIEFGKNFLRYEKCAMQLYHKELDIIAELTLTYTGVKIYNKLCTKKEKVNHLISNLHKNSITTQWKWYKCQCIFTYINVTSNIIWMCKKNCYINITSNHFLKLQQPNVNCQIYWMIGKLTVPWTWI